MNVNIWNSEEYSKPNELITFICNREPQLLGSRKEAFFKDVGVLVYVFDIESYKPEVFRDNRLALMLII